MSSNATTVIVLAGMFLGLPVALLLARDWLARPSKRKLEEYSRQFTERLRHPDLSAVEKHFGRPLPSCVQALYADPHEVLRGDFEVASAVDAAPEARWYIAFYQPADEQSVRDSWPGLEKYFAFTDDGCGNGYLIDPKEDDPAVLFHDRETGELALVCDHFTDFMKWPRLKKPNPPIRTVPNDKSSDRRNRLRGQSSHPPLTARLIDWLVRKSGP